MSNDQSYTPPVAPSTPEKEEGEIAKISQVVLEKLDASDYNVIVRIARNILKKGLNLEESCILANVPLTKYQEITAEVPEVKTLIRMKEIEYKAKLLHTITRKAVNDDKSATWLLQSKFPEEYGSARQRTGEAQAADSIAEALEIIQAGDDNEPIVAPSSKLPPPDPVTGVKAAFKKVKDSLS